MDFNSPSSCPSLLRAGLQACTTMPGTRNPRFHQTRLYELVDHACNPSYSGGRDQEDPSLKPAQANSSGDPISKNLSQKKKKGLVEWFKVKDLSSSPSTTKKKVYMFGAEGLPCKLNLLIPVSPYVSLIFLSFLVF
jgi:hypothetical protein